MNQEKNLPLLWKIYDHIVAHPQEWEQSAWGTAIATTSGTARTVLPTCTSAFCVAGHAVAMTHEGAVLDFSDLDGTDQVTTGGLISTVYMRLADGSVVFIEETAREVLGLKKDESQRLFSGGNSLEDIHRVINEWQAEADAQRDAEVDSLLGETE